MFHRSSSTLLAGLLFSSIVLAEDSGLEQSAENLVHSAEDELSALEQTVGKQTDITDEEAGIRHQEEIG